MNTEPPDWTKEPWGVAYDNSIYGGCFFVASTSPNRPLPEGIQSQVEANARRICACVNALVGIRDPAAEIPALRARADAGERLAEAAKAVSKWAGPAPTQPYSSETAKNDAAIINQLNSALALWAAVQSQTEPKL